MRMTSLENSAGAAITELVSPGARKFIGVVALTGIVVLGAMTLTAQEESGNGVPINITFEVDGANYTMPSNYYQAVEDAGNICSAITESDIVGQAEEEDGTAFNWKPGEVSPAGAEGPAQFEEATFTEETKAGVISGGDIWSVYDSIRDMGQLDCYNAKKYGSIVTAFEVYVSGRPGVDSEYADTIEATAATVNIATAPATNPNHGGGSGHSGHSSGSGHGSGSSFAQKLVHAGYDMNTSDGAWTQGESASAPFPGHPNCPRVVFEQVGSGWSVNFVNFPANAAPVPNNATASDVIRIERRHLKCD